jgi:hypothetical protein
VNGEMMKAGNTDRTKTPQIENGNAQKKKHEVSVPVKA